MSELKKPPLGLMPKYIWDSQRLEDIQEAIKRYAEANKDVPVEWIDEYTILAKQLRGL